MRILFRIQKENVKKKKILDIIVKTKNLISEVTPPKKDFLIVYCKNIFNDHCVKVCRQDFYVPIYWVKF